MQHKLLQPVYHDKLILIAWEHKVEEQLTRSWLQYVDSQAATPTWQGKDFDSPYIINIDAVKTSLGLVSAMNNRALTASRIAAHNQRLLAVGDEPSAVHSQPIRGDNESREYATNSTCLTITNQVN